MKNAGITGAAIKAILTVLLAACAGTTVPTVTPSSSAPTSALVATVAAVPTLTATPTLTTIPTSTPTLVLPPTTVPMATPTPTSTLALTAALTPTLTPKPTATLTTAPTRSPSGPMMEDHYALVQERTIGPYTVQLWEELGLEFRIGPSDEIVGQVAAILRDGRPYALHWDAAVWLTKESGTDLTGEGNPDLVLAMYSGGAHCCISTIVYDLGETPTKVLETPYEDAICEGYFQDLDGDGVPEFVTCDTLFFFGKEPDLFSCYNWPGVRVVLRYDPGRGYVTASPQFAEDHQEAIAEHTEQAERAEVECKGRHMCDAVMVALNHLYTDRPDEARSEFSRLYKCPNALEVWDAMVKEISYSEFYAPRDAPKAIVRWPSYYVVQLSMPSDGRLPIALYEERRPVRTIPLSWFEALLRDIDLVVEGEVLELLPESGTAECPIAVVDRSAGSQAGTICLDVSSGFPGEVYRVDNVESDHWRLKGNLTWERVPS